MIESEIQKIGEMAYFEDYPIIVLFNESVPKELEDVCIVHRFKTSPQSEILKEGQIIRLGDFEYEIQEVGVLANENLRNLGHISLQFGNETNDKILPGTVLLNKKELPKLNQGDLLVFGIDSTI